MACLRLYLVLFSMIISPTAHASKFIWYHQDPVNVEYFTVYCGSIPLVPNESINFTPDQSAGLWPDIPAQDLGKVFMASFDNLFPWCWMTATNAAGEGGPSDAKPFPTLLHDSSKNGCVGLEDFNSFRSEYGLCEPTQ